MSWEEERGMNDLNGGQRRDRSCFRKTLHGSVEDQFKGAQMETRRSVRKEASTGAQPR